MNYYYDVLLNFLDTNIYFYEWDSLDNIEYYKRVPLIQVNSKTLKDFINNNIVVEKEFLDTIKDKAKKRDNCSSYIAIFADKNGSIALEFDENGNSIARSFLGLEDDLNICDILYTIDILKVNYKINTSIDYNDNLRIEDKIKLIIKTEVKSLYKKQDFKKLKYLFMEWFNKIPVDNEVMYQSMIEELNNKIGDKEKKIYDLIKLSYNKV